MVINSQVSFTPAKNAKNQSSASCIHTRSPDSAPAATGLWGGRWSRTGMLSRPELPVGQTVGLSSTANLAYGLRASDERLRPQPSLPAPAAAPQAAAVAEGASTIIQAAARSRGVRRDAEQRWHYDVVATQVLTVPQAAHAAECLIKEETEPDDWETESIAPESEHPMLSAALADDEPRK